MFLQTGWLSNYEWPLPGWCFQLVEEVRDLSLYKYYQKQKTGCSREQSSIQLAWGRIWLLNLPKWIVTAPQLKAASLIWRTFFTYTPLYFSDSDLSYWNLGWAKYLTAPNHFYLFVTLSLCVFKRSLILFSFLMFHVIKKWRRSPQQMKF